MMIDAYGGSETLHFVAFDYEEMETDLPEGPRGFMLKGKPDWSTNIVGLHSSSTRGIYIPREKLVDC